MVGRESPVASATAVMPPHPMASASQAAQRRRTGSSMTGLRAWYLFRIVAMISPSDIQASGSLSQRVELQKERVSRPTGYLHRTKAPRYSQAKHGLFSSRIVQQSRRFGKVILRRLLSRMVEPSNRHMRADRGCAEACTPRWPRILLRRSWGNRHDNTTRSTLYRL